MHGKATTALLCAAGLAALLTLLFLVTRDKPDSSEPEPPQLADRQARPRQPSGGNSPFDRPRLDPAGLRLLDSGPAATLSAHSTGDGTRWSRADDNLLVSWAARDPGAAMDWIDSATHSVAGARLLGAIATGILIRDGVAAMHSFIADHQNDPRIAFKHQGSLERFAFYHLGREDTITHALRLLRDTPNGSLAGSMVLGVEGTRRQVNAIDYLEAKGLPVDIDYWSFQTSISEDPRYWADWAAQRDSDLLPEIIQAWARDKPAEANTWIERHLEPDNPRRVEIRDLIDR